MRVAQRLSQVFGWGFVVIGLAGFAATGGSMEADHTLAPRLFGVFPVNVTHNIVHLVFGLWGVFAARSVGASRTYLLGSGLAYLVLAALGFVIPDGLGLVPIGGNDIGLHLFLAIGLLFSGLIFAREGEPTRAV